MKLPFLKFFPADWLMKTRPLSLAAKGGWIDVLCHLHNSPTRGTATHTITGWARVMACSDAQAEAVIAELDSTKTADVSRGRNGNVTLTSRRMFAESLTRQQTRQRVAKHRLSAGSDPSGHEGSVTDSAICNGDCNADVTDRRQKTEDRDQKTESEYRPSDSSSPAANDPPETDFFKPLPTPEEIEADRATAEAEAATKAAQAASRAIPFAEIIALYNRLCPSLPRAQPTDSRRRVIRARVLECQKAGIAALDWYADLFRRAEASDFLSGRKPNPRRPWRCSIDFLIARSNWPKVLEGNYDDRTPGGGKRFSIIETVKA